MFLIGGRLREEREAKKLSQSEAASKLSISTKTWGKYERGVTMPDAATLALLAEHCDFDIPYILTGARERKSDLQNEEEVKLIENYRVMDGAARLNMQAVSTAFAAENKLKKDVLSNN